MHCACVHVSPTLLVFLFMYVGYFEMFKLAKRVASTGMCGYSLCYLHMHAHMHACTHEHILYM